MLCDESHEMLESYGVWGLKKFMGRDWVPRFLIEKASSTLCEKDSPIPKIPPTQTCSPASLAF